MTAEVTVTSLDCKSLVAGDRVAFVGSYEHQEGFGVVARVTPTGRVTLEDTKVFNADGRQIRVEGHSRGLTLIPAVVLEERQARKKAQREKNARYHETLTQVQKVLNGKRNGFGDFVGGLSVEEKAELTAMIAGL